MIRAHVLYLAQLAPLALYPGQQWDAQHAETYIVLAAHGRRVLHLNHQMQEVRTKRKSVQPQATITTLSST